MGVSSESIRLELSHNGQVVATAGVGPFGVLTGIVSWVRRNPAKTPANIETEAGVSRDEWLAEELVVDLGGLDSSRNESVNWVRGRRLAVGDEVVFRVLAQGPIDEAEREPSSRPERGDG